MHISSVVLALLATSLTVEASALRKFSKYHEKRSKLLPQPHSAPPLEIRQSVDSYLNSQTQPYAVDGANVPEVPFDIGESYAGTLPVDSTGKELFFWFVPTTNPAASDEITVWLNGGPGCSSLDGFLHENGPVIWQPGQHRPVRNDWAWSNLSNVVWVDQPVGTGFSTGTVNATDEVDVATQFRGFWRNFVDLFSLQNRSVYITGESYAGQYVPYIADGMLNQTDPTYFNVSGILIYDPSLGHDSITEQVPTRAFVDWNHNDFPFNDTFSSMINNMSSSCGYDDFLANGLTFPPKGPFGPQPGALADGTVRDGCDIFGDVANAITELNPCFDIYVVGSLCPILWDVLGFPYSGFYLPPGFDQPYFNRSDVKTALHAPQDVDWRICANHPVFANDTDLSPPSGLTGGPIQRVTEKTNNTIVGHGTLDMVLILNGTLLTLNNLTWNGAQGFSSPPTKPFYVPYHVDPTLESIAGAGVYGSWTADRGLTFVSVDISGHEVPEFQPSAAYRHLELLLGRIRDLSDTAPFTTRPEEAGLQLQVSLGSGTGPV